MYTNQVAATKRLFNKTYALNDKEVGEQGGGEEDGCVSEKVSVRNTDTHRMRRIDALTQRHTGTQKHRHTNTQTRGRTDRHTHRYAVDTHIHRHLKTYGVATISRLLKITGLFCRISCLL